MSISVDVNDPAYPPGALISVAGIRTAFKNGETAVVEEAHVFGDGIEDVVEYLKGVTGFTVKDATGGEAAPSSEQPPVAASPQAASSDEAATTPEGSESQ